MNELIKATISFSWAMSLLGIRQISSVIAPADPNQVAGKMTAVFDSITYATEEQFDDAIKVTFRTGDQLQRGILDLTYRIFTLDAFTPRGVMKMSLDLVQQSAEALKLLTPGRDSRVIWQEFKNKLETFNLFEHVDSRLNIPSDQNLSLPKLVERAYMLEPYLAVWAIEGLGHYYAERMWEQDGPPTNLLTDAQSGSLSPRSMIALHTGMGLSFANRILETVQPQRHPSEIRKALEKFIGLCTINSREGYAEAAIESLGLVARNLYPQMLYAIDEQCSTIDPTLLSYFWHGVGRAIYFAPQNFIPCGNSSSRAVEMCGDEPPHELGRLNALAGLAWAMMLVNIRQPQIIEALLKNHGDRLSQDDAFSNGVSSSVIVWRDSTQGDPYLARFCQHQPGSSDPHLLELWNNLVKRPCETALRDYYVVLKKHDRLGELFRYQSLPELIARLEGEPVSAGRGTEQQ